MTLDELLRIANAAGGTGSGMGTGAPSLPAGGPAPAPTLQASGPVPQPAMATPPSVSEASMGAPDVFERLARAGQANPLVSPVSQVADLVGTILRGGHSGYGDMYRRGSIDKLQSELDAKAREDRAAEAKAARLEAEARKKAVTAARIAALDERIKYATERRLALQKAAEASTDASQLTQYKREAAALDAQQKGWERAKAKILGLDALDSTIDTTLPDSPPVKPKPEASPKEDLGSYVTVQTPQGKKLMRQAEAAAAGYVPTGVRDTRTASPSEREQLSADISLLAQIGRARESYKRGFVGPLKGRASGLQQKTIGIGRNEASFRSNLAAIRNQILKMRSGGAVTEGEAGRLLEELPTVNDTPNVFDSKMDSFEQTFRTLAETRRETMSGLGIDLENIPELPARYVAPERPSPDKPPGSDFDPLSIPGARRVVPVKAHTRKTGGKPNG